MAKPRRQSWKSLDPAVQAELSSLLTAYYARQSPLSRHFYDDADGFHGFMLLAFLASAGGAAASVYEWSSMYEPPGLWEGAVRLLSHPIGVLRFAPEVAGVLVLGPAALVILLIWLANFRRRGLALIRDAVVIVRGPRLSVIPLADVASARLAKIGSGRRSFTELQLAMNDGGEIRLWTRNRDWAGLVADQVAAKQPAALPA